MRFNIDINMNDWSRSASATTADVQAVAAYLHAIALTTTPQNISTRIGVFSVTIACVSEPTERTAL